MGTKGLSYLWPLHLLMNLTGDKGESFPEASPKGFTASCFVSSDWGTDTFLSLLLRPSDCSALTG